MADDNTPILHGKKLRAYARVKQMAIERNLQRSKEAYKDLGDGETFGPTGIHNKAGKNELAIPPPGKAKYQHRQKNKTWLPTHVWHAKRAHLETKWGFSVVKTPTAKSYRPTHRASTISGAVAWDASFYSTIILESASINCLRTVISKVTRSDIPGSDRFTNATRCWEGMMSDDETLLGPGLVYWCHKDVDLNDTLFSVLLRIHPACFTPLFAFIERIKQNSANCLDFTVYDCRFTIGSIDITGSSSIPALASVFKLADNYSPSMKNIWKAFGSISNTSCLPRSVVLTLNTKDPRFSYPPQPVRKAKENEIVGLATNWPDSEVVCASPLFTPDGVNKSYVNQSSQKEVERRRRAIGPGIIPTGQDCDPLIPIIMLKRLDNSWTVLLPWGWVMPVWHSLMHINDVHLGGTDQSHQISFEGGRLYFPDDFPGTPAGTIAEQENSDERKKLWTRKPPGKRTTYSRLKIRKYEPRGEVGSPFRCDWHYLYEKVSKQFGGLTKPIQDEDDINIELEKDASEEEPSDAAEELNIAQPTSLGSPMDLDVPETKENSKKPKVKHTVSKKKIYDPPKIPCYVEFDLPLTQLAASSSTKTTAAADIIPIKIIPVKVNYLHRGSPSSVAHIYKIPESDRTQWFKALRTQETALEEFPECPSSDYLIGFITTGSYNLKEGYGFGIGSILSRSANDQYCLVRNVGSAIARIAKWEKISI